MESFILIALVLLAVLVVALMARSNAEYERDRRWYALLRTWTTHVLPSIVSFRHALVAVGEQAEVAAGSLVAFGRALDDAPRGGTGTLALEQVPPHVHTLADGTPVFARVEATLDCRDGRHEACDTCGCVCHG